MSHYGPICVATTCFKPLPKDHPEYVECGPSGHKYQRKPTNRIHFVDLMGESWYYMTKHIKDMARRAERKKQTRLRQQRQWRLKRSRPIHGLKHQEACKIAKPQWADCEKINAIYAERDRLNEEAGYFKYAVDHVIPIRGKEVCGLHVHENLAVILAKDNHKKGNVYHGQHAKHPDCHPAK